jgi:hypothetical protein
LETAKLTDKEIAIELGNYPDLYIVGEDVRTIKMELRRKYPGHFKERKDKRGLRSTKAKTREPIRDPATEPATEPEEDDTS